MALNLGELLVRLGLDTAQFNRDLKKSQDSFSKVGQNFSKLGQTLTMTVTAPILGLGTAVARSAADFESSMNRVKALTGATGTSINALTNQAKELGITTRYSASQAADAMGFLAMAGFKANQIMSAMPGTLNLAAAANLDLAQSADIVSNILTGYGMEVKQLGRVNDVLVKAFTSANTNLQQLGEAMKYAGPVASGMGMSFEEAAAALAMMGNAGIQASMAGTSLRGALTRLAVPTKDIKETLERLGITVNDSSGKMLPLVDIIRQLEKSGASTADMMVIFGQRAGPAMAALVDQGSEALQTFTNQLKQSGGTADRIAAVQQQGLKGSFIALKSAAEGLALAVGDSGLTGQLTKLTQGLTKFVQNLAKANPETLKFYTNVILAAAAVGPLALAIGKAITMLSSLIAGVAAVKFAFAAWLGGAATLTEALLFISGGPVAWIIAGIVALVGVGYLLIKNWDKVRDAGLNTWGALKIAVYKFVASFLEGYAKLYRFFDQKEADRIATHAASLRQMAAAEEGFIAQRKTSAANEKQFAAMRTMAEKDFEKLLDERANKERMAAEAAQKAAQEKADAEAEAQAAMTLTAAEAEKLAKAQRHAIQTVEYQVDRLDSQWSAYQTTIGKAGSDTVANARQQEYLSERLKLLQTLLTEVSRQYADSKAKTGEYSEATMDLGSQLDRTNGEIAKTKAELSEISGPILEAKNNLTEAGKAVQLVKEKMAELSTQLETAKGKFEETSKKVKELQDANKDAQQTIGNALGAMRDRIKDVADEMKDLNDSTKEAQQGIRDSLGTMRDRIKDIADQMKDLQDANKTAQQTIGDALGTMRDRISEVADEMKEVRSSSKDAEQGMADAFASMKARAGEVKDQISDLQSKMKDVASVKLSGEGAMGQELQDLERREALVRMAMNRLKLSGVENNDQRIVELQKQLDKIGLQKESVRLRIETEIEPLKDELKRLTDQSKEMSFEDAKAAITGYQKEIATLTTKHAGMTTQIDSLQAQYGNLIPSIARTGQSFDEAVAALVAHRGELITNATKLANLSSRHDAMQKEYDGLLKVLGELVPKLGIAGLSFKDAKTVIDDNKKAIEGNNKELGELTTKQNDMQKEYDALVATLGDVVPKIGIAGQTFDEAKTAVANHKTAIETNTAKLGELTTKHNDMKLEYDNLLASLGDIIPKIGDANLGFAEAKTKIDEMSGVIKRNNDILDGPGGLLEALEQQRSTVWTLEYGMKIWGQELDNLTRKEREAASALDALRASAYAAAQATAPGSRSVDRVNVSGGGTIPIPQPFAKGGIVKRPTLGLLGERGTEVVMPLARIGEMLQPFIAKVGAYLAGARGAFGGREGQMAMASVVGGGVTVVNVRIGERQLEDIWVEMQTRSERRGRT